MKKTLLTIFLLSPLLVLAGGDSTSGLDMSPLLFIILSLFIGINTKRFLRNIPIPYTVILLIIGILLGTADRFGWFDSIPFMHNAVDWAGHIHYKIILFVFLPTLIFEAAFDLDVHTFKKSFWNAFLMAVPGIIVGMCLSGALTMLIQYFGIGFGGWSWYVALMFGAVICATDPVAVVSLLKELGGGKKLRTLIESESLLNDGTALVIFMVFFTILTDTAANANPIIDFFIVTFGGIGIGAAIGLFTLFLLKKVFNDPLFEITGVIGSAYLTFYIAESFHLSGVIGLVTLGLLMAGRGKTRISPEVAHFLHDFWVLAAFLANTLIFIIVGVIISNRTNFKLEDFIDLALIYIGIHLIRGLIVLVLFPVMKRIGYGVSKQDALVLWWGGLRGVIGLAMALIIAESSLPSFIKEPFLFITAGIVLLTSIINATTIKALVKGLGLTKITVARAAVITHAMENLRGSAEERLELMKNDRFMGGADWETVSKYLPKIWQPKEKDLLDKKENGGLIELRTVLLNREKTTYWNQFSKGLLGRKAYNQLVKIVDELLDEGGKTTLSHAIYIDELWNTSQLFDKIEQWTQIQKSSNKDTFNKLIISYDACKGFVKAQDKLLELVNDFKNDESNSVEEKEYLNLLENEVNEKKIQGLTFLRNLKNAFPEVYKAIETRQASRDILNHQKNKMVEMKKSGRIDKEDAHYFLDEIEVQMNELLNKPLDFTLPDAKDLIKDIKLFSELEEKVIVSVIPFVEIKIFPFNYQFKQELDPKNGLGVICRGSAKISNKQDDNRSAVLAKGDIISDKTVQKGDRLISETPLTVMWIPSSKIDQVKSLSPVFKDII
jgi:NhaP-type Na+/H+ or K+/H+ antiporter